MLGSIGGGAALNANGSVAAPSFAIQGGTYYNVGDALGALNGAVDGVLGGIAGMRTDISYLQGQVGSLQQSVSAGGPQGPRVAVDGAADGSDAASVSAGSKAVAVGANANAGGSHGTAVGGDSYAAGPNDTALGGNARVGADGSTAVGANTSIATAATNAVAVGESATVTAASATAIGQGATATAAGAVALGQGSLADRANAVSVGSAANQRQITHVAAGTQASDAANTGQVQQALATAKTYADAGDQATLSSAQAYTDQKVSGFVSSSDLNSLRNQVSDQFHAVNTRLDRVGAMGAAMSQMAFSTQGINSPNRLGVGVGGYKGQAAVSVGYSRALSPNANLSFGGAVSNGGEASGGVGVGFGW